MMLYYFVEFAGSFANIALLLLFIGRLFPKKEPVSRWFYAYVALLIAGQCALSLFPDWVTQRTIYLLVGGFFLALLFYEVRPWQAVFASGAFFTLIALVEVLAMLLIGLRIPDTDILMQAGAARLVYVVFSNLIQIPLVVLISHFFSRKGNALRILWLLPIIAIQQTQRNNNYGCCRSLRFKSQVLLSVMWHSIMLRMSISRIIWSVLWRCFSL